VAHLRDTYLMPALEHIGDSFLGHMEQAGLMGILLFKALTGILRPPYDLSAVVKQLLFIGVRSLPVIVVAGAFTGMVLALQFYNTLDRFGTIDLLGSATALALVRELGPVMAALMVVGRAGSAMCSEIGIMRIYEQIDALDCMAIDPYKFLVAPKIVAGIIAMPVLTSIFDVVGIGGGYLVGVVIFGLSEGAYFDSMRTGVEWNDVAMGLYKSILFGLILTWISTAKGFFLHRARKAAFGAEGVARVTTEAVVLSSIAILFGDYLVGALML
jgi:phospholipid/cholesterol/gamma-HCH transport system permease protein